MHLQYYIAHSAIFSNGESTGGIVDSSRVQIVVLSVETKQQSNT